MFSLDETGEEQSGERRKSAARAEKESKVEQEMSVELQRQPKIATPSPHFLSSLSLPTGLYFNFDFFLGFPSLSFILYALSLCFFFCLSPRQRVCECVCVAWLRGMCSGFDPPAAAPTPPLFSLRVCLKKVA